MSSYRGHLESISLNGVELTPETPIEHVLGRTIPWDHIIIGGKCEILSVRGMMKSKKWQRRRRVQRFKMMIKELRKPIPHRWSLDPNACPAGDDDYTTWPITRNVKSCKFYAGGNAQIGEGS